MELIPFLQTTELFSSIDTSLLETIVPLAGSRSYSKGAFIFRENTEGNEFYIVKTGAVAIQKNVAGGRKRNLSILRAGEFLGELALFDNEPRSADAEVMDDTEVMVFDNKSFLDLLDKNVTLAAAVQKNVIRILCQRLRSTDEMLKDGVIWGFRMES